MTSEADRNCPDRKNFFDAIEYLKDPWNKEKLQHLLSYESWKRFVAAAKLSRDEADALYADLSQLETFMAIEDQENRERFMKEFPQVKQDLEDRIRKLYALADEVDKVHRDCTVAQVVSASTGAVSGLLTIAGLLLAPFTAGASLVLSGAGVGLGAAAAVTGVTANIVDKSKDNAAKAKASHLVSTGSDTEKVVKEAVCRTPEIASLAQKCFQSLEYIVKKADVLNADESNYIKAAEFSGFKHTGAVLTQSSILRQVYRGSAKSISKGARVLGAASAGLFLFMDVWVLKKELKHLHEGAKAPSARKLRQQAQELELWLEELTRIHESLQEDLTP